MTVSENDLREALDELWGEIDNFRGLSATTIAVARANHSYLWHASGAEDVFGKADEDLTADDLELMRKMGAKISVFGGYGPDVHGPQVDVEPRTDPPASTEQKLCCYGCGRAAGGNGYCSPSGCMDCPG